MNLRDLEYLIAIDEERHFNKAAERCCVSQPTLSGQLKKLEEELDITLVERSNRRVVMTDAGTAITEQARIVMASAKTIKDIAQSFHDPMSGDIHLGLIPTIAPYLLPLIMSSLKKQYPNLRLWLHENQTKILLSKLRRAELDVLILALPIETDEFCELNLFTEDFLLAVPNGDKLANLNDVSLRDIKHREMLLLEEGHCLRGQALDVCSAANASEYAGFRASSLETLRHIVGEGMGITLIPELAVPKRIRKDDNIRYLPFRKPAPNRHIGLLYRYNSYRESVFHKLGTVIKTTVF